MSGLLAVAIVFSAGCGETPVAVQTGVLVLETSQVELVSGDTIRVRAQFRTPDGPVRAQLAAEALRPGHVETWLADTSIAGRAETVVWIRGMAVGSTSVFVTTPDGARVRIQTAVTPAQMTIDGLPDTLVSGDTVNAHVQALDYSGKTTPLDWDSLSSQSLLPLETGGYLALFNQGVDAVVPTLRTADGLEFTGQPVRVSTRPNTLGLPDTLSTFSLVVLDTSMLWHPNEVYPNPRFRIDISGLGSARVLGYDTYQPDTVGFYVPGVPGTYVINGEIQTTVTVDTIHVLGAPYYPSSFTMPRLVTTDSLPHIHLVHFTQDSASHWIRLESDTAATISISTEPLYGYGLDVSALQCADTTITVPLDPVYSEYAELGVEPGDCHYFRLSHQPYQSTGAGYRIELELK